KAAAYDFAVSHEIPSDTQHFGHAAERHAKTGDNFIEDNKRAIRARKLNHFIDELAALNQQTVVRGQRFKNHRRDFFAVPIEDFANRVLIVERRDQSVTRNLIGYSGTGTRGLAGQPAAGLYEQRVRMAVIATFEFQNAIAIRRGARDAQSAHNRLGAGRDKAQHLNPGQTRSNPLGEY